MRGVAGICGVLGGACWIAAIFLSGDLVDYVDWVGAGLLSLAALASGLVIASGSLLWLRAIVGIGCVALGWSLVAVLRAEVEPDLVRAATGALAVMLGLVAVVRRTPHVAGTHSR